MDGKNSLGLNKKVLESGKEVQRRKTLRIYNRKCLQEKWPASLIFQVFMGKFLFTGLSQTQNSKALQAACYLQCPTVH